MRVIYGNELNTTVPEGSDPKEVLTILKESYAELSNAEYNVTTEAGEQVMRVTLKAGNKA